MHHLFLELDYLVRITITRLCKDVKALHLQGNAKLAQKREHKTKTSKVLTGGNILLLECLFSRCKASNANIANFV